MSTSKGLGSWHLLLLVQVIIHNYLTANGGCCILRYRLSSKENRPKTHGIIRLGVMLDMHHNHTSER